MPPVLVDPSNVRSFESQGDLDRWLGEHHAKKRELWIKIHKKGSGLASVTYHEALDVALAWGWIDGIKKPWDERSFLQRFTPRRARSAWSQRNRDHVERLTRDGRMRPPGLLEVDAAKADGRWAAAYAPASTAQISDELVTAILAVPAAQATFARLDAVNRFALAHRFARLKTAAGRTRAVERYVAMLARGETLHPLSQGASARTQASKRAKPSKPAKPSKRAEPSKPAKTSTPAKPSKPAKTSKRSR